MRDMMNKIISRDEILEGYQKLENIESFFDSDVLILPSIKDKEVFLNQATSFTGIKVKLYCNSQKPKLHLSASQIPGFLELGGYVISTISGMITIFEFIKRYKDRNVSTDIYIKIENNVFLYIPYKGEAYNLNNEIDKISSQLTFSRFGPDDLNLIRKYKQLYDEAIITQEEFEAKKKEILGV
jgi:hypothetical protein